MGTLQGELSKWAKNNHFKQKCAKSTQQPKKQKGKLSTRDLEELMGTRKPVYRRGKGGAVRQK